MNARYYDPEIGQFIGCPLGADTIVPDHEVGAKRHPTVLIDYNRFAYARANPLGYTDPSGHEVKPTCLLCNVTLLDYSNAPGWLDQTVDGLAQVGCFVAGCNADTQTNTIAGPTEEQYVEQLGTELITGGMAPLGAVKSAVSRASNKFIRRSDVPRISSNIAQGGKNLPNITGQWLRGTEGNVGRIPGQIAEQLRGQSFNSFDEFREAFWMAVANDKHLAAQFSTSNYN